MAERLKAPVLKTGRRESVSWVRIPPHPPPHCSLKFADVFFYQLKQSVIDDSCSTRYAFICANSRRSDGTNDGTDYEDGWLTSLNARFVETTKKVGMHADGMGLYLKVKESGKKYWIYRYQDNKRRRDMSFGPYPIISLADARDLARCKKGSKRRLRRRMKVSKITRHIADRRKANNHEITTDITRRFSTIVIEDLKVSNMTRSAKGTVEEPGRNVKAKSGLNRAILNVAPFQFRAQLEYKILSTGGEIISVDPKFTSQTCNVCGVVDAKSRKSQDKFKCTSCGYEENADINAARVILGRGLNLGSVSGPLKTPSELRRSRKTQRPATSKPHVSQSLVGVTQQNRGAVTSKIEGKTDV